MIVLGIESSCDETAASVVKDGNAVLANVVASQIELHAGYGGVVPELAAREHLKAVTPVIEAALAESGCTVADLDGVAVTSNPGLIPALLVGVAFAKGLAAAADVNFVGINHFIAHIYGAFIEKSEMLQDVKNFPLMTLVVSGGHTALVLIEVDGSAKVVGTTIDDAAGEAYDKAAKILELGYPGGPVIDKLAKKGNDKAYNFPRALLGRGGKAVSKENLHNFSFSGVKTALLYAVKDKNLQDNELYDVIASYQAAIVDVLVLKTIKAAKIFKAKTIVMAGGVACNSCLRKEMTTAANSANRQLVIAPPKYCTDNAAMIAGLAYHYLKKEQVHDFSHSVNARLPRDLGILPFAPLAQ